jgi:hypothetical protein
MPRLTVTLLPLLALAGCPSPSDITPVIHVDPRAAQRLQWLADPVAAAEAEEPAPATAARVHAMKEGEQLGGPGATGRPGDLLLENAEVAFVVGQVGGAGPAERGGSVLDAADATTRKDELGQVVASFGAPSPAVEYRWLRSGAEGDGSAWIEVVGRGASLAALVVTTRYTLHGPDRALLIETTVENPGDVAVELPAVGDAVEWGTAERVADGEARGFAGPSSGVYIGAVGRAVSYALTSTDGSITATSGGSWSRTTQRTKVTLAGHDRTQYARVLLVGQRGDTASLVGELAMAAGQTVGAVKLTVPGAAPGATVSLVADGSTQPITLVDPFEAMLPEGRYWITAPDGHRATAPLDVKGSGTAAATVAPP